MVVDERRALVIDEHRAAQGLFALNDVLEALVGDIHTSAHPREPRIVLPMGANRAVSVLVSQDG